MRKVAAERREFVEWAEVCWVCGKCRATDCHEMASGSHRGAALSQRFTWLATCTFCNCYLLTDRKLWPLARQLALKWIYDQDHFHLTDFNLLRGRAPGAIGFSEVAIEACRLLDGGPKWTAS
jgi:hypothetical protein